MDRMKSTCVLYRERNFREQDQRSGTTRAILCRPLPLAHEPVTGLLAKQFFRGEIAIRGAELVSECFARRFFDPRCQLGLAVHQRMQIQRIQSEQPRWCHRPQPTMTLAF